GWGSLWWVSGSVMGGFKYVLMLLLKWNNSVCVAEEIEKYSIKFLWYVLVFGVFWWGGRLMG
ncbi:hypothetical protein, partial [Helicobacter pylori]|uniref:hypothetical protein n=1 Tax=Helicobacter pylori TaxID=210 RepID=UPI001EE957E1